MANHLPPNFRANDDASNGTNSKDILTRLPFDLAVMVIKKLRTRELYTCSLVSRGWRKLLTDPSIIYPILNQISHFDQEPILFRHLPNGHDVHGDDEKEKAEEEGSGNKQDVDSEETPEALRMRLEEGANQQWVKNPRVLMRLLQKLLNREHRWRKARPTMRLYLPPVPLDGTNADIEDEWQGAVKMVKMKSAIVAVLYDQGKCIHLWNLAGHYDKVREITEKYISDNNELLKEQKKYGGPELPPFTDADVEAFLKCSRSGIPTKPAHSVIRLRKRPAIFDFQTISNILVTATAAGEVDVYDMKAGKHLRTFVASNKVDTIGVVHVWLDYVIVAHGSTISLWNHKTGETLEDNMCTTHRANITGAFVLDNDNHVLTIDETGVIAITDRSAERTQLDTLLDTPMYPIFMIGKAGAPYMMRLLHMSHLCVWGRFGFGHYELFEPGLQNLPPLDSLVMSTSEETARLGGGQQRGDEPREADADSASHSNSGSDEYFDWSADEQDEEQQAEEGEAATAAAAAADGDNDSDSHSNAGSETHMILEQLRNTHEDMETMYSHVIGDIDAEHPQGTRRERQVLNRVPEESRYHMISIDSPFERGPVGDILSADFRRALYLDWNFIQIADLESSKEGRAMAVSLGVYPTEPMVPKYGPGLLSPPPLRYCNGGTVDPESMAKRRIVKACSRAPMLRDPPACMPQPYKDGFDPENDQHMHLITMLHGSDGQGLMDEGIPAQRNPNTNRLRHFDHTVDNDNITLVYLEARIMRYIVILYYHIVDGPPFIRKSCTLEQAEEAREYVSRFMPEIFDEIIKGTGLHLIFLLAPYYIQRIFESQFEKTPVLNVDHRGQAMDVQQLWRDVDRIHSVTKGPYSFGQKHEGGTSYYQRGDVMPYSMHGLQQTVTAMDDAHIAFGCANGYVVIISFD
ncbi:hypothetical protein IW140_005466 [Coemansia sp. RSA 1813]|nr:hypothetical protein IW138_005450 [Coemansia sp. RSA 986]KAJ2565126.1 hypothetical protein IW140_005466 [Coemansia sp. RSA 1813]